MMAGNMDGTVAGQDGTGGTGHVPYTQVTVAEAAAVLRQAVERQTGALRQLERENGRLTAENEALRAAQAVQDASGAPQPSDPSPEPSPPADPFPVPMPPSPNVMAWLQDRPIWRWLVVFLGLIAVTALA